MQHSLSVQLLNVILKQNLILSISIIQLTINSAVQKLSLLRSQMQIKMQIMNF